MEEETGTNKVFSLQEISNNLFDDHILKRVDNVLDLSWLHKAVKDCYCQDNGRPSIDPKAAVRQQIAINRTIEAIAKGEKRVLLCDGRPAQEKPILHFKSLIGCGKLVRRKRILFLADRTALIDQARRNDFRYFRDKMTVIKKKVVRAQGKETLVFDT